MSMKKILPKAEAKWDYGMDGRNPQKIIEFSCPICGKRIREKETACDKYSHTDNCEHYEKYEPHREFINIDDRPIGGFHDD